MTLRNAAVLLLVTLGVTACSSNKNHAERERAAPFEDPAAPPCPNMCLPDPGSRPVDCAAAEAGLEFIPVWNFDDTVNQAGQLTGADLYSYDDGSQSFLWPTEGYQPPAIQYERCGNPDNHVFHLVGGPFYSWGGGIGRRLAGVESVCDQNMSLECQRATDAEFPLDTIDLSRWEGISFWARVGPNGQPGIRVAIGDKYTDDDLAFRKVAVGEQPYCRRKKECGCRTKPCSPFEDSGVTVFFCWDPLVDPVPLFANGEYQYDKCAESMCDEAYPAFEDLTDVEFEGDPCTTYAFRGGIEGDYCFNPATDPPPPESSEECGDHWFAPVHLTTDWQFFKVPFTDLLQQGWAKRSDLLDLTSASVLRFTWDRGWAEFYLDDVRFYRRASN